MPGDTLEHGSITVVLFFSLFFSFFCRACLALAFLARSQIRSTKETPHNTRGREERFQVFVKKNANKPLLLGGCIEICYVKAYKARERTALSEIVHNTPAAHSTVLTGLNKYRLLHRLRITILTNDTFTILHSQRVLDE